VWALSLESILESVASGDRYQAPARFSGQDIWRRQLGRRLVLELGATRIRAFGSTVNQTAIHGFSDIDYLLIMPFSRNLRPPAAMAITSAALRQIASRDVLVLPDDPALSVADPYDTSILDFVPAIELSRNSFLIPALGGAEWMETAPLGFQRDAQKLPKSGSLETAIVRLLKSWKYRTELPIRSVYLERLVLMLAPSERSGSLYSGMAECLERMLRCELDTIGMSHAEGGVAALPETEDVASVLPCVEAAKHALTRAHDASKLGAVDELDDSLDVLFPTDRLQTRADVHQMWALRVSRGLAGRQVVTRREEREKRPWQRDRRLFRRP
jgi:hypothetical protein